VTAADTSGIFRVASHAVAFGVVEGTPPTLLRYRPATGWTLDAPLKLEQETATRYHPRVSRSRWFAQAPTGESDCSIRATLIEEFPHIG
jgi:hypothetical protein